MGIIPIKGKKRAVEDIVSLSDIDPVACKEILRGEMDSSGRCVIRIRYDPDDPTGAELEKIRFIEMPPRRETEGKSQ
ncbi:MAG: hypothetical protein JRD89_04750 [Deltaproteobacteria bacterium]|nr:hypothetical protein [Deltaproteobacteria bacterium]